MILKLNKIICNNSYFTTYELDKEDIDAPKTDKRKAPVIPKNGKILVNVCKK